MASSYQRCDYCEGTYSTREFGKSKQGLTCCRHCIAAQCTRQKKVVSEAPEATPVRPQLASPPVTPLISSAVNSTANGYYFTDGTPYVPLQPGDVQQSRVTRGRPDPGKPLSNENPNLYQNANQQGIASIGMRGVAFDQARDGLPACNYDNGVAAVISPQQVLQLPINQIPLNCLTTLEYQLLATFKSLLENRLG